MATINGKGLAVTYNGQAITDYVNQQAVREELDRVIREIDADNPPVCGTFSGSFSVELTPLTYTFTVNYRIIPTYTAHCNRHLRNRIRLAPYRRVRWGVN